MNFLFHMFLSGSDDRILTGNFMGDFVKGPLAGRFPEGIRQGVELHRRIDSYAEQHPLFRASRSRISQEYGLYRGIMVDMFYDYFLANDWRDWSSEPFTSFLRRTRIAIDRHHQDIPPEMLSLLPVIFDDLLPSYGTVDGIGRALARLSRRIGRDNPLSGGERELSRLHDALHADFTGFTTAIISYSSTIRGD